MQAALGSSRDQWASGIGWIVYSLNEIDYLLLYVYGIVTQQPMPIALPSGWMKVTTAGRLKMVEDALEEVSESPATIRIKRLFVRTRALMDRRNHIAHGVLAQTDGGQYQMLRYHKASDQMLSLSHSDLLNTEKTARKLSDDFSLLISLCRLYKEFVKPYGPGEPQGFEQIKPHDPAPAIELENQPEPDTVPASSGIRSSGSSTDDV